MLVLRRNVGEKILIGDDIVITVIHTGVGKVRLGVDAPADIRVMRTELLGGAAGDSGKTSAGTCGAKRKAARSK